MSASTIRWDRDPEDGIVILTLDDPEPVGEHDEHRLRGVDAGDGRAAAGREGRDRGRDHHVGQEDLLRRRRPQRAEARQQGERARSSREFLREVKAQLRAIETLGVPVVAAINGAALGGGLEIALAAHHRVIVDDSKAVIGFPEVQLGLLPGAGGVTRTVRMIGIAQALMGSCCRAKRFRPAEAKELGLVDEIVPTARRPDPGRKGVDRRRIRRPRSRGTRTRSTRSPAAPRRRRRSPPTCRRSRPTCASRSRARTCRRR